MLVIASGMFHADQVLRGFLRPRCARRLVVAVIDGAQSAGQRHSVSRLPAPVGDSTNLVHTTTREGGRRIMATDYDTPRKTDDDISEDSIEELKARSRSDKSSGAVDTDETELA